MLFGIDKWPNKDERDKTRGEKDGRSNESKTSCTNVETISSIR